jgi:3-hydroxybutyryl-CoA dehydratase
VLRIPPLASCGSAGGGRPQGGCVKRIGVGDTFEWVREVDPYRPVFYAGASGDYNPIHIDRVVGRAAGYKGVILQGMCTFSWLSDACVAYLGDPASLKRLRARFTKPVQVGDVITFQGRCVAVEGGRARLEIDARNQAGDEVLKGAVADAQVGAEPGEAEG